MIDWQELELDEIPDWPLPAQCSCRLGYCFAGHDRGLLVLGLF